MSAARQPRMVVNGSDSALSGMAAHSDLPMETLSTERVNTFSGFKIP